MLRPVGLTVLFAVAASIPTPAGGAEALHVRIDALIAARANGRAASPAADDAEFLRRVYLDLAGRIPSVGEARAFLQDTATDKRTRLIDQLLACPEYPRQMADAFNIMLMERLGDNVEWMKYLRKSFETNKPWDQMAREMLRGSAPDEASRGAVFFYSKRLEHYGENPVDYPGLTRDVGRLFLGIDLQCAACHDHRFIKDYKQLDYQGLFAFFQNAYLVDANKLTVAEKPTTQKITYQSVFNKVQRQTGPRVPFRDEIAIPAMKKGEEYLEPPDRKTKAAGKLRFSPLEKLAEELPVAASPAFSKNIGNRLWFILMGRGLVHPLDLSHKDNPPSHPELLDLLARELVEHKFDMKYLLRELALTQAYQRSSLLPDGQDKAPPESYRTANEKRLSAEQLLNSMLEATGMRQRFGEQTEVGKDSRKGAGKYSGSGLTGMRGKFAKAFANQPREAEVEISPSLKAALFLLNDDAILGWLKPQPGNLIDRLSKLSENDQVAEELYLSVLTRLPLSEEEAEVGSYLAKHVDRRAAALEHLAWALLASTEFCVNH